MEHRWGRREHVTIPVRLCWRQRRGAANGEITNLSVSGAWIRTAAVLPLLMPLEVDMLTEEGRSALPAFVVRRSSGGVGIEWREPLQERLRLPPRGSNGPRVLTRHSQHERSLV